jgi:lipopolysaccharide/colanic/teichoic acid biosynthesis glycosyltransferase
MDEAAECAQWQRGRLDVTPGLTCIWQVKGRSRVSFADWMRMDLSYIAARTWHDVRSCARRSPRCCAPRRTLGNAAVADA